MSVIDFRYRDAHGRGIAGDGVPFGARCYSSLIHHQEALMQKDIQHFGLPGLVQLTNTAVSACAESRTPLIHPNDCCGRDVAALANQAHRLQCCTHYFDSLVLFVADGLCRRLVAEKVAQQGLGNVAVELMADFNRNAGEWRVAAKYPGRSVDLYELRVKKDGSFESSFIEGDELLVEEKIREFFS